MPRLSCWADPDAPRPATVMVVFAGMTESLLIRLVPVSTDPSARTASIATEFEDMGCRGAPRVGLTLSGRWMDEGVVTLRYSAGVDLVFQVPGSPSRETRYASARTPLLCRVLRDGDNYRVTCQADGSADR